MKAVPSIVVVSLMTLTGVNAFVTPQNAGVRTAVSLQAHADEDGSVSVGDVMKGLAFSALFGLSMVVNPLPSMADGESKIENI